ncbi:hypothetical protein [Corynebacterium doosanense]|uniref:Uncharacterized protein n=1 Tax=Corynebacterium doosanense CAU 212 = DSM 45436 TaxID=558173 RepID=A0A097IJ84_9CORY|nr:hypothetical protein [Corynebacterium doosanense]AIT62207.1 hypothetical protein CDOO_02725 [Corynebacterium doosanense CAU 212 = DSM 45436]
MVTVEQREQIAQVPRDVLRSIMGLTHLTYDSVDALLPEDLRYLAQPILDLLLEDESLLTAEPESEPTPEPTPREEAAPEPEQAPASKSNLGERFKLAATVAAKRRFNPDQVFELDPSLLSPYQWGADEAEAPGVEYQFLNLAGTDTDQAPRVELAWSRYSDDPVVFYRIVATTNIGATPNPEINEQLAFTEGVYFEDPVPSNEAFREYQVWVYRGADDASALVSQPELVGRVLVIFPVRGIKLTAGEGVIAGTWTALPGHHHMRVFVSDVKANARPDSSEFQLREDFVQPMRFEYITPERGVTKRVVLQPEIKHPDGTVLVGQISPVHTVDIKGELAQVEFNDVYRVETENGPMVAFSVYGPPVGDFHVYLTQTRPSPDLTVDDIPAEALSQEGMDDGGNISHPFGVIGHNEELAQKVYWPQDWDEVFVTPVVKLGNYARVGPSVAMQHVDTIDDAEIREFVGYQLVTFGWPRGASLVRVQRQPQGSTAEDREIVREFTEEEYREQGGVKLFLDNGGEDVVLTPQKYYENKPTRAEETIVSYPGLWKFLYSMCIEVPTATQAGGISLRIWSDGREIMNPPNFSVVFNPTRKPLAGTALSHGDRTIGAALGGPAFDAPAGTVLIANGDIGSSEETAQRWFIPVEQIPGQGFLRVLLVMDEDPYGDQIRQIITDECTNGGILRQHQIDWMRRSPQVEPQQPDNSGTRRRGFFGRG